MSNSSSNFSFDLTKCIPQNQIILTIFFVIKGTYGFLTILIYILNVKSMSFASSRMNKSFYKLYTTVAFLSSFYFIEYYLVKQFPSLGWLCESIMRSFSEPNFVITPSRAIAAYCPIALLIFHWLISLHRLFCLVLPIKIRRWDVYFWKIWTVGILLPVLFMWFVVPSRGFVYIDPLGGLNMEYEDFYIVPGFKLSSTLLSVIAAIIFGSLTLINTVAILILLKKKSSISEKECSLVYFEILLAFVTLIFAGTQTVLYYAKNMIKNDLMRYIVELIRTYVVDIFILPNAWTILIFSKNVRRGVKETITAIIQCRRINVSVKPITNYSRMPSSLIPTVSTH